MDGQTDCVKRVKTDMEIDPVCGMSVEPTAAAGQSEYLGKTYYFCSLGCKQAFDKEPEKYLGQSQSDHSMHHE